MPPKICLLSASSELPLRYAARCHVTSCCADQFETNRSLQWEADGIHLIRCGGSDVPINIVEHLSLKVKIFGLRGKRWGKNLVTWND